MPSKHSRSGRTFTVAGPPPTSSDAGPPPFSGAFNSNSMPQAGSGTRAPLAVRASTPPSYRRKESVALPSPILPRSGLLDTPAASAASLSSAPTRSFRDVVAGGLAKSTARLSAPVVPTSRPLVQAVTAYDGATAPDGAAPSTPMWALQPPSALAFSAVTQSPLFAPGEGVAPFLAVQPSTQSSFSSVAPVSESSSLPTNAPMSALDALVLADNFLASEAVVSGTPQAHPSGSPEATAPFSSPSFLSAVANSVASPPEPSAGTIQPRPQPDPSPGYSALDGAPPSPVLQAPNVGSRDARSPALEMDEVASNPLPPSQQPRILSPLFSVVSSSQPPLPAPPSSLSGQQPPLVRHLVPPLLPLQQPQLLLPKLSVVDPPQPPPSIPSSGQQPTPVRPPVPPFRSSVESPAMRKPSTLSLTGLLPSQPSPAQRLVLTAPAMELMIHLHHGDVELLQPLEESVVSDVADQLQRAAQERFGLPLARKMAMSALEVSRHQCGASGWPTLDVALSCLRVVNGGGPPTDATHPAPPAKSSAPIAPAPPLAPQTRISNNLESLMRLQQQQQQEHLRSILAIPWLSQPGPPGPTPLAAPTALLPPNLSGRPLDSLRAASGPGATPSAVPSILNSVNMSSNLPPPPLPAPPLLPPRSGVSSSARFRRRAVGPIVAPAPTSRDRCTSCGHHGHDALRCSEGLDVTSVVDAAEHLEAAMRERTRELSSVGDQDDQLCEDAARNEAASAIADLSGIAAQDVTSFLSESQDAGATLVSAVCHARGGGLADQLERQCQQELSRRRRTQLLHVHSRDAAQAGSSAEQYAALADRVNLPSQLGYGYRLDTSGVQLPAFPSRPPSTGRRRRAQDDDLRDFVVDDHDSSPEPSPKPRRDGSRHSPPHQRRRGHSSRTSDSSGSDRSDSSSRESSSDFSSESASGESGQPRRRRGRQSSSGDSEGSGGSGSGSAGSSSDSGSSRSPSPRRDRPSNRDHRDQVPEGPLTASALASLVTSLTKRVREGNGNGMLASKPPSFWGLGKPPSGGYFPETFNRIYNEYRQFRSVFGSNTGLSFKRLITEEMQPTVRRDLKLTRSQFRKIDSKVLVSKLKKRLCFHKRDVYVAELEACPRIPAGIKDISALNVAFKDLSSKMLDVVERAHRHGVRLRKSSCKHILGQAVKNSYRLNQWFHLSRFKSIGESVRKINTKLQRRLSTDAEKRHEQTADQAMHNGVRQQVGDGHMEGSSAPERPRKGGAAKPGAKGGISKQDTPRLSPEDYAKKMDALYRVENALEKGRHFHKHGPFCNSPTNCTLKFCQGCGEHQVEGKPWHDRPKCRARKHHDFVATGYWHDRWPNRLGLRARPDAPQDSRPPNAGKRNDTAARANHMSRHTAEASTDAPAGQ